MPPVRGDQAQHLLLWDAGQLRMLWFKLKCDDPSDCVSSDPKVYGFSYLTNAWRTVDTYSPGIPNDLVGTWDARANGGSGGLLIVTYRTGHTVWWSYDPTKTGSSAWTDLSAGVPTDLQQDCFFAQTWPCFSWGVTYDATNQRTIVLGQDASKAPALWAYDALANTWQSIATSGSIPYKVQGYGNNFYYSSTNGTLYFLNVSDWGAGGIGGYEDGSVQTWRIQLDLGNPLPTNTPASTPTFTPTQPTATSTQTPTVTNTQPTATPTTPGVTTPTPTCAGTVRLVGPGRTYTKPSQAAAVVQTNDCVDIDAGSYPNDVALWPASASNVTIRGVGGMVHLTITNGRVYGDKAIWVVDGANTTIENIEFSCATSRANNTNCSGVLVGDGNDAGIRLEAAGLTVRNCIFRDNDDGILGGPNTTNPVGDVLIEHSEFFRNGWGDGQSHNLYMNAHNATLTFRYNYSHGAITGHNLKSRAATNYILYNRIMDGENGATSCDSPPHCSASVEIELPYGGLTYVIGNVMQKGPLADAGEFVKYAAEGGANPIQELYVINNTMVSDYGSSAYFIRGYGAAPLLWSKNNIFWGTGTTSWPVGSQVTANNVTADPKLLSESTYDYHLTAVSTAAIDAGTTPGTDSHGYNLAPTTQYVYDRDGAARPSDGLLDAGAFEYVAGATPFPTPTNSPTNTPTPSPAWSPTPASPGYCPAGQLEAVYSITASANDGAVKYAGSNYAALNPSSVTTSGYGDYQDYVIRRNQGSSPFSVGLVEWRWNTAARPDNSAWPTGTVVTGAFLRPYWAGAGTGTRPLIFEWHNWPPPTPLANADWTLTNPASGNATYGASISMPSTSGRQLVTLNNAAGNVSLTGYTGVRLSVSDATPPASGEDNTLPVRPRDYQTSAGDLSTQLVICYLASAGSATPTPQRPSAPQLL